MSDIKCSSLQQRQGKRATRLPRLFLFSLAIVEENRRNLIFKRLQECAITTLLSTVKLVMTMREKLINISKESVSLYLRISFQNTFPGHKTIVFKYFLNLLSLKEFLSY